LTENFLERVRAYREEELFPRLFGFQKRGIFPITGEILSQTFRQETYDPRWLFHGVFEFAPTPSRASWLYVTSGMSNDWEADAPNAAGVSGLGTEFIFETTGAGNWAISRLLQLMAYQILLYHGRYPGHEPLGDFDRLPLRSPIGDEPSDVQFLMIAPCGKELSPQQLESGSFEFLRVVGITDAEVQYARAVGGGALLDRLREVNAFPVTCATRPTVPLPPVPT
jgi:hypothetical protein